MSLIERSLGSPQSFPSSTREPRLWIWLGRRYSGPENRGYRELKDLRGWVARTGLPTVLKANGTSGGEGVRVVDTLEEAERAFRALQAPPLLARAVKRALVDQDKSLVWPSLLRHRSVVNAQALLQGTKPLVRSLVGKGTVLASLHFEVINKRRFGGPSSVVRSMENAEMSAAAEKMVAGSSFPGIHGFDFMLEARTGEAHLIEINPRATQVGHLALGPGAIFLLLCTRPCPGSLSRRLRK